MNYFNLIIDIIFVISLILLLVKIKKLNIKIDEVKKLTTNQESKIDSKVKEISDKIDTINELKKYLDFDIGDMVYIEWDLIQGSGSKNEIQFTFKAEGQIIDITSSKAKVLVTDGTASKSNISKQHCIDWLNNSVSWYSFSKLEKRISQQDRRDMKLNQILNQ